MASLLLFLVGVAVFAITLSFGGKAGEIDALDRRLGDDERRIVLASQKILQLEDRIQMLEGKLRAAPDMTNGRSRVGEQFMHDTRKTAERTAPAVLQ